MKKRPSLPPEDLEELAENEEFISRDNLEIITAAVEEEETGEATVWVRFANFEDIEEAESYAEFLQTTLPLLLFETTRIQ
jgi:hypothetical protein